ncbi:MAG: hypothetical protein Q9187_000629 [Circinaria calcarea]
MNRTRCHCHDFYLGALRDLSLKGFITRVANWLKFNHAAAGCQVGADCLTCAIRNLLDEYWTYNAAGRQRQRNNAARRLQGLFGRVSSDASQGNSAAISKHFTQSGNQEDAQELYVYLYDVFDRQLPPAVIDVVHSIFYTEMRQQTRCLRHWCSHLTRNYDMRTNMVLGFPETPAERYTLVELIQYHFDPYHNARPGFQCPQCTIVYDPEVRMEIVTAADVLVIHLARFSNNINGVIAKVGSHVKFGKTLDLSKYLITPGSRARRKRGTLHYELVASLQHSGTLHGGHYITAAKDPAGTWHEVEDAARPRPVTWDIVQGGRNGFLPYMLFYRRIVHRVAAQGREND